jgi:NAD(P)-dependent dehydrogenase (short-subunit alcohol dehydrogenase family)
VAELFSFPSTSPQGAEAVAALVAAVGDVDILVNNVATLVQPSPTADVTAEQIAATFAVSVTAPFLLTGLLAPAKAERGHARRRHRATAGADPVTPDEHRRRSGCRRGVPGRTVGEQRARCDPGRGRRVDGGVTGLAASPQNVRLPLGCTTNPWLSVSVHASRSFGPTPHVTVDD